MFFGGLEVCGLLLCNVANLFQVCLFPNQRALAWPPSSLVNKPFHFRDFFRGCVIFPHTGKADSTNSVTKANGFQGGFMHSNLSLAFLYLFMFSIFREQTFFISN